MSDLDWGAALRTLGSGMMDMGRYNYQRSQDEADAQHRRAILALQEAAAVRDQERLEHDVEQDRLQSIRDSRKALMEPAKESADALRDAGIMAPADFFQNAMQAQLRPESNLTTAGTVMEALRSAGQSGVDRVYREGPEALNRAWKNRSPAEPMPGGGFAGMSPSVLASLENAEASRELTRSNRQTLTASQRRAEEEEEAEGLAILNSPNKDPIIEAFGAAYRGARKATPNMSPGQLAKRVMEGLRQSRPDLFQRPGAEEDPIDEYMRRTLEGVGVANGLVPHKPTRPPMSERDPTPQGYAIDDPEVTAAREIVAGMNPAAARQMLEAAGYDDEVVDLVLGIQGIGGQR